MADSVVKLRIDSSEYESKMKRAAAGLLEFEDKCRRAGTTIGALDDQSLKYVQSLGKMVTQASNTKGSLREMTTALTDMTAIYRRLTDEEKKGMFGQELAKQIKVIEERAASLQDTMGDVAAAIKAKASDTGMFDQIAGGIQGVTTAFQIGQGAANLFGIEIGDNVQVIAKLQSAMAVTSGLMQAQNLLQRESAMMMGVAAVQARALAAAQALAGKETKIATLAQTAFNAVAKANPYVLLASAVAAVGVALLGFSKNAKTAAESQETMTDAMKDAQRMADVYNNTMQSSFSSLRSKYDELQRAWNSLKNDHQRTEWIKENQQAFRELGIEVNSTKQAEDVFNGNTDAVVQSFVRRAQAAARVAQLTELYRKQIELLDKRSATSAAISSDAQRSGRHANAGDPVPEGWRNSRYGRVNNAGQWEFTAEGARLYSGSDTSTAQSIQAIDRQLEQNAAEIEKVKRSIGNEVGSTYYGGNRHGTGSNRSSVGSHTAGNTTTTSTKPEYIPLEGSIDAQMAKVQELQKAWHAVATEQERAQIKAALDKETEALDQMQGKVQEVREEYIPLIGSIDYQEQKVAALTAAWKAAADDDSRRRVLDELNQQKAVLDAMEGKETISTAKGNETSREKGMSIDQRIGRFGSGLGSIEGGMRQMGVELPNGINKLIGAIQGVSTVIQGVQSVIEAFSIGSQAANTIAVSANTVALAGLTTAMSINTATNFIPFFSHGGIAHAAQGLYIPQYHGPKVPGSSFSGDNVPALLDSGELILNKAQQGVIGEMLNGASPVQELYSRISGEDIILSVNNTLKRTGRGEIVTSRSR